MTTLDTHGGLDVMNQTTVSDVPVSTCGLDKDFMFAFWFGFVISWPKNTICHQILQIPLQCFFIDYTYYNILQKVNLIKGQHLSRLWNVLQTLENYHSRLQYRKSSKWTRPSTHFKHKKYANMNQMYILNKVLFQIVMYLITGIFLK